MTGFLIGIAAIALGAVVAFFIVRKKGDDQ